MRIKTKVLLSNFILVLIPILITIIISGIWFTSIRSKVINSGEDRNLRIQSIYYKYKNELAKIDWKTEIIENQDDDYIPAAKQQLISELYSAGFHFLIESDYEQVFSNLNDEDIELLRFNTSIENLHQFYFMEYNSITIIHDQLGKGLFITAIYNEQNVDAQIKNSIIPVYLVPNNAIAILIVIILLAILVTAILLSYWIYNSVLSPVILVTTKKDDIEKVKALGVDGADIVVKSFEPKTLEEKNITVDSKKSESIIEYKDLKINKLSRRVFLGENEISLKNKEFELLLFLAENPGIVFSKETIFESVWGLDSMADNVTVTVHVNRIRDKIEKNPSSPEYIQTVWGVGYRFAEI